MKSLVNLLDAVLSGIGLVYVIYGLTIFMAAPSSCARVGWQMYTASTSQVLTCNTQFLYYRVRHFVAICKKGEPCDLFYGTEAPAKPNRYRYDSFSISHFRVARGEHRQDGCWAAKFSSSSRREIFFLASFSTLPPSHHTPREAEQ